MLFICFKSFHVYSYSYTFALMQLCWMKIPKTNSKKACVWVLFGFGFIVLLGICALQSAACFNRDGFVITIPLSNSNETICDAEQHLITTNIVQHGLVIVAYALLVVYACKWYQESKENLKVRFKY